MKKFLTILLYLFGGLYCYGLFIDDVILQALSKPIPILLILAQVRPSSKYNFFIMAGLFFSLIGDILLLALVDEFLYGLAAFLITHLFYIVAFLIRNRDVRFVSMLVFYLIGGAAVYVLYPYTGEFRYPVIVYVFVIVTMAWRAYSQRNYNKTALYAYLGAMTFLLSDFILAYNKFIFSYHYSGIISIVIYWTAQYMIAKSTVKNE